MKWIVSITALAMIFSVAASQAQTTTKPDVSTAPSAGNSGAGIAGAPGNKNGPAAQKGNTTGSNSQPNPTVQQQDPSKVQGLPGNKSGPAVKPPNRQ